MSKLNEESPQNPYDSFVVHASAGSGKTFQLSKRYLNLIAAGASPAQILTITFTVKAANEMRARIIAEAYKLLVDASEQKLFNKNMAQFYAIARPIWQSQQLFLPQPLSAEQTAKSILAATQTLKISTIDALFKDWVSRFPWEAGQEEGGQGQAMPASFSMLDPMDFEDLNRAAWLRLFLKEPAKVLLEHAWQLLKKIEPDKGPLAIEARLYELFRLCTYLWYVEKDSLQGQRALISFPLPQVAGSYKAASMSMEELIRSLNAPLGEIARQTRHAEALLEAIAQARLSPLHELKLLTKEGRIHGGTIRGQKRLTLQGVIMQVEEAFAGFYHHQKLEHLNLLGSLLYDLYQFWSREREHIKGQRQRLEFHDLAMGCYRLFNGADSGGALWLLQKSVRHLLLDEFQDTSLLQWRVFESLARELLSGLGEAQEDGIIPTVFIVGDAKQSIYSFREADPEVMHKALEFLAGFQKKELPLSKSFRTAQIVLDLVNLMFARRFKPFAHHETATLSDGNPFIPDCGRVVIGERFEGDDHSSAIEQEAEFVARYLAMALSGSLPHPVFDKSNRQYRPLRLEDCCLLYRNATHVAVFEKALRKQGIAYRREEKKGFFERCEIQDILALLRYLCFPEDLVSLCTLLKSPLVAACDEELYRFLEEEAEEKALHEQANFFLSSSLLRHFPDIAQFLEYLQQKMMLLLPHQLLSEIYRSFQALEKYQLVFGSIEGQMAKKNLIKLLELCSKLEEEGYGSLLACLQRLETLASKGEMASASFHSDALTLMTIHKAKGLEFPFIALIEAADSWHKEDRYWLKRKSHPRGVAFIGTKQQQPRDYSPFASLLVEEKYEGEQESLRLLYVALSRASQYLLVTGHKPFLADDQNFLATLSQLVQDHGGQHFPELNAWYWERGIEVAQRAIPKASSHPQKLKLAPKSRILPLEPLGQRQYALPYEVDIVQPHTEIDRRLGIAASGQSNFSLSPKLAALIGTYIHEGLAAYAGKQDWDQLKAWERLVKDKASREQISTSQWQKIYLSIQEEISQTRDHKLWQHLLEQAQDIKCEMPLINLFKDKLIRGSIDLFLKYDKHIIVIDYKTSSLDCAVDSDDAKELLRAHCAAHGYSRQLWAYCHSVKKMFSDYKVIGAVWLTKGPAYVPLVEL